MLKICFALLLPGSALFAQSSGTAYDAMRTVGTQLNRDAVNRVVSIVGVDGKPQPATWHVMLRDTSAPGGVREVLVTNGRVTGNHAGGATLVGHGPTIDTTKLNLDSSGAYEVASKTADTSHVPFSFVSYTLRPDERGNPTWVVTLQNQSRRSLGTIYIGANKGTVTRTEGMFQGLPPDAVVEDQREGEVQDEERSGDNPVTRSVRHMFYRARDQAQDTFKQVRRNFADFIRGDDR